MDEAVTIGIVTLQKMLAEDMAEEVMVDVGAIDRQERQ